MNDLIQQARILGSFAKDFHTMGVDAANAGMADVALSCADRASKCRDDMLALANGLNEDERGDLIAEFNNAKGWKAIGLKTDA